MRCEPLVLICLLSIVLASSAHNKRKPSCSKDQETEPASKANCQYTPKSTKMAANAADEASAAKNAQKCASEEAGQRAMDRLADKAEQAARAAEAALNGKKQLLEELHRSQCEAEAVIDEVKESLARSRCNIHTIIHVAANIKNHLELLQTFLELSRLNLEKYKELVACAEREIQEKYMILMSVRKRVEELKNCMQHAKKDLFRTEEIAQRAENAAVEATHRVEMSRNIFGRAKKLKKKDLKSFVRIFKRFVKK